MCVLDVFHMCVFSVCVCVCPRCFHMCVYTCVCFHFQYTYKFIKSPLFVLNSLYDTAQLAGILGLDCLPPHCDQHQMKFFDNFRNVCCFVTGYFCVNYLIKHMSFCFYKIGVSSSAWSSSELFFCRFICRLVSHPLPDTGR